MICEKVARYAERVHHPDRLTQPAAAQRPEGLEAVEARSRGTKRSTAWPTPSPRKRRGTARETVWPYFYAGTMGLVQRDGIQRLRHAMKYSRWFSTICVTLSDSGWIAGVGSKRGVDLREAAEHAELIVIWGGNPVNTQVNVMQHAMAAKKRGAKLVVVDPYRTGTAEKADLHLALQPGTDGALACAVMHVLFAEGFADWDYLRRYTDCPDELAAHLQTRTPEWAAEITGLARRNHRRVRAAVRAQQAQLHPLSSRLLALAQRRGEHACGHVPARGHRRLAASGRWRALRSHRDLSARPLADRRLRRDRSIGARARSVASGADPHRRSRMR